MTMESLNLNHLTTEERERILAVLNRNDSLERREQERVKKIQIELKQLRLKGVIKEGINADKTCARCRSQLGIFFNRGDLCPQCHAKVCSECRHNYEKAEGGWLCSLCHKQLELETLSGKWFYKKLQEKNNRNKTLKGADLVKVSIRRGMANGDNRSRAATDLKRSLLNNNASPKPQHKSANSSPSSRSNPSVSGESDHVDGYHGDRPGQRHHGSSIHQVGFPRESDRRKLMDLLRPQSDEDHGDQSPAAAHKRQVVKQVHSGRYRDSDSDSLSSGPSSPQISSPRTQTNSIRSSNLSSEQMVPSDHDGDSITSSPRLLSGQTGMPIVTTNYNRPVNASPSHRREHNSQPEKSVVTSSTDSTLDGATVISRLSSSSSDSEEEFVVEEISRIKFRKCSTKTNSPRLVPSSPTSTSEAETTDPRSRLHPAQQVVVASSSPGQGRGLASRRSTPGQHPSHGDEHRNSPSPNLSVRNQERRSSPKARKADVTATNGVSKSEEGPQPTSQVPVIAITQDSTDESCRSSPRSTKTAFKEVTQTKSISSSIKSDQSSLNPDDSTTEDPDFDELFRSHGSSFHSSTANESPRSSNLLTPFSDSHESIVSVYSDAGEGHFGKIEITGEIQFSLDYNYKSNMLEIRVKQCRDLAAVDKKHKRSDPYVKTYLLPDKTKGGKRKTRLKKHTLNPNFEETLKYNISKSELETRSLWVSVWHGDRFGRNAFLGEVNVPMDYHNFDNNAPVWYPLQDRRPSGISNLTYKGDLIMSLKYVTAENVPNRKKHRVSSRGELLILVKEAHNLTAVRANGFSDPFCKCYLLPDRSKAGKQKTAVIKKSCNPRWNHCFLFENVTLSDLQERCLELTIWDYDRLNSNDFLGGLRLSLGSGKSRGRDVDWMDSRGEEMSLWQSMIDRPNTWIEGSLMLRSNMDKRSSTT